MTPPQGLATFPGIGKLLSASISLGHGISPGTATLTIVPQAELITETGTLVFSFGDALFEFPGCKVDRGSLERNSRGEIWRLSILDRRWRWKFGAISGSYNLRRDDGSMRRGEEGSRDSQRTPQQLAALCLTAMGESHFDVLALPNDARPSVEWDWDVPAEMLSRLCDELGCRIVLQLDNRVAIRRAGVGAWLGTAGALEFAQVLNPPERPDALAVVCGPNRYQVDFPLEAVGLEADAAEGGGDFLRPLDALSYRPSGGWSGVDLPYFHQVATPRRSLALRSVFRYYRIRSPISVPGYGGPVSLEQLLPIEDEQVVTIAENGQVSNRPAAVFGVWHREVGDMRNTAESLAPAPDQPISQGLGAMYTGPLTIDTARGLVIFEEPVYRNLHAAASGESQFEMEIGPAKLVLRAACSVRDLQSFEPARHVRTRTLAPAASAAVRCLKHDEIVLTSVPRYSESYNLTGVDTNLSQVNQLADRWLDLAALEYHSTAPQTARYAGLVRIELDGAIEQVGFHVGPGGATTTASRQSQPARGGWDHAIRRGFERTRGSAAGKPGPRQLARSLKQQASLKARPRS